MKRCPTCNQETYDTRTLRFNLRSASGLSSYRVHVESTFGPYIKQSHLFSDESFLETFRNFLYQMIRFEEMKLVDNRYSIIDLLLERGYFEKFPQLLNDIKEYKHGTTK